MLNQCNFIGNLGRDPEIRQTQGGKEIANLSLGVTERWREKSTGERKENTEWVRVVCFSDGLTGVIKNYCRKGSRVFVSGKMQTRKWQNQEGQDQYTTEIVLQGFDAKIVLLDSKSDQEHGTQPDYHNQGKGNAYQPQPDLDDEIPF